MLRPTERIASPVTPLEPLPPFWMEAVGPESPRFLPLVLPFFSMPLAPDLNYILTP